jgi:ribose transport system permease protein
MIKKLFHYPSSQDQQPWRGRSYAIPCLILLLYALCGFLYVPSFLRAENLISILFSCAITLPVVMGMQALLIVGFFDLSVGAIASFVGMAFGLSLLEYDSFMVAGAVALFCALAIGAANGLFVTRLAINPLISTLAMTGILRSSSLIINDGRIVASLPRALSDIVSSRIAYIPGLILLGIFLVFALELCFRYVVPFRRFYAAGSNPTAANHAGIRVANIIVAGYVAIAVGSAATGVIQASRTLSASPLIFDTLALEVIAACIIGGGTLKGGQGTMIGAALGLLVVTSTRDLVVLLDISVFWKDCVLGVLLLGITSIDYLKSRLDFRGGASAMASGSWRDDK